MKNYKIHYSKSTYLITTLFALGLTVLAIYVSMNITNDSLNLIYLGLLFIILTSVIIYLFRPLSYSISNNQLIIHRKYKDVEIPLNTITSAFRYNDFSEIGTSIRLFGSGGVMGWFGVFYSFRYGLYHQFSGSMSPGIMISTQSGRKYAISPIEIDEVVSILSAKNLNPIRNCDNNIS